MPRATTWERRQLTMWLPLPLAALAPVHTAPKTHRYVNELVEVRRCMAEGRSCWRRVGNL